MSDNGYFDACGTPPGNLDRNWWRHTITHDVNSPPWPPGQAGDFEFEILIGTSAVGPFTPAPLTQLANQCSPQPDNLLGVGGVTQTVFGIGGPAELLANTDYWIQVILRDGTNTQVDQEICGPIHTPDYPTFTCLAPIVTQTTADVELGQATGRTNVFAPCNQDSAVWEIATAPGGPWTSAASEPQTDFTPEHTFTGLTPNTTYFYRARFTEQAQTQGEYLVTDPCQFTTEEAVVTTPPFNPQPCAADGAGSDAVDVENIVLCDLDAEGNLLGTALAVYEYDNAGNPTGAPTFVDPATGVAYVPQGTLQVCPDAACLPPMQFCQTSTTTGPVEHPGRQYDITLPINPGFAVDSLQVGAVNNPAGIVWDVVDQDGETFRQDLTAFLESRLPSAATVTITNPNAGLGQVCGAALPMQVHIECLRLDQSPPDLIELVYNGGQDLIQNPAYNETPPLNPPVSQGNYGFHLLARQDDPGPFPGNPPANRANCTSVANRGWETNDVGRTFEIWGQDQVNGQNVTPTPRGTPVQEMTSDGPPPGGLSTIWQTFQAPASGNFVIRVVHGSRDPGETHRITLDNGDTGDAQNGDLIDDVTNPPSVTSNGGPNPWTQFNQSIPLNAGSTYTLALSSTNPVLFNRGGLFTDMRAYLDRPGLRATAVTDDDTCVVTTEETTTNTVCSFWQPQCAGGVTVGWQKVDTGETLSNAEFWAQVPAPECCKAEVEAAAGGSALSNMLTSDLVCGQVGGIPTPLIRVVVTDPSGGTLQEQFLGASGAPVAPTSWVPGSCTAERFVSDIVLCDQGSANLPFLRKYIQSISDTGLGQINSFRDFLLDGSATYTPVGPVVICGGDTADRESVCWTQTSTGDTVHTGTIRHQDSLPAPGWILFDQNLTPVLSTEPGLTFVPCAESMDPMATTGLCLANGTPIGIITRRNSVTGVVTQDGWLNLLTGAFTAGNPPAGTTACGDATSITTSGILCDIDGGGNVVGLVIVQYEFNPDGSVASTTLLDAVTGAVYVPVGTVTVCPTGTEQPDADLTILCDDNGSFVRDYRRDETGAIVAVSNYTLTGAAYVPVGTVSSCGQTDNEIVNLCDVVAGTPIPFLRTYTFVNGAVTGTVDTTPSGAPYAVTGTVTMCGEIDTEPEVLCDIQANGTAIPFKRRYSFNATTGLQVGTNDTTLDGSTPYAVTGTVGACTGVDAESAILCDSAAVPNRFIRTYRYAPNGAVAGFTDTTLAGAPFVPTGAVGVCATTVQADTDFVEEILCDSNGTSFIRLFRFNSTTGALVSTTNTTLAGAAFAPVGTVGLCSDCCPNVVADNLCTNTGSGRGTAIRATNGTITLIDSVSGATITAANIVPCPSDDTVVTLTAQGRLVGDADAPWTPGGDVVGTLTSVTMTVLSGTATLTDQSGTVLTGLPAGYTATWTVADENTLTGPQSIDAIGGQTAVVWTQR